MSAYSCTASALAVVLPRKLICFCLCACACVLVYVFGANHVQACCDSDLCPSCLNQFITCDMPCEPVCSVQRFICRTRTDGRLQLTLIGAFFCLFCFASLERGVCVSPRLSDSRSIPKFLFLIRVQPFFERLEAKCGTPPRVVIFVSVSDPPSFPFPLYFFVLHFKL